MSDNFLNVTKIYIRRYAIALSEMFFMKIMED